MLPASPNRRLSCRLPRPTTAPLFLTTQAQHQQVVDALNAIIKSYKAMQNDCFVEIDQHRLDRKAELAKQVELPTRINQLTASKEKETRAHQVELDAIQSNFERIEVNAHQQVLAAQKKVTNAERSQQNTKLELESALSNSYKYRHLVDRQQEMLNGAADDLRIMFLVFDKRIANHVLPNLPFAMPGTNIAPQMLVQCILSVIRAAGGESDADGCEDTRHYVSTHTPSTFLRGEMMDYHLFHRQDLNADVKPYMHRAASDQSAPPCTSSRC